MDKMRNKHVAEMERLKEAIAKTSSKHLKNDYTKALRKMQKELAEYDRYRGGI